MKKKKVETVFTKPLLARVTIPVLATVVVGLGVFILRQPPLKNTFRPSLSVNGQPVVSLFIEEPPEQAAKDNAAYYYQKAYIQLLDLFKSDKLGLADNELLKHAEPALLLFSEGTRMSLCDFSFGGQVKQQASTFRKAISRVFLSQVVMMKTDTLIAGGQTDEALEWYRKFFVYLAHLSSQKNLSAAVELIADKEAVFEKLRVLIEEGKLSLVQKRALLSFLLEFDRSETPFSVTMMQAAEEARLSLESLPKEIAVRYAKIAGEYFSSLAAVLDSPDEIGTVKAIEKKGSLSSFDPQLVRVGRLLVSKSNIDRKQAAAYLASARTAQTYDDIARIVFILTCPSPDVLYGDYFIAATQWRLLETALAVSLYQAESGRNPASPGELVPRFLPRILKDPYGEAGFMFKDNGGMLTVSSRAQGLEITPR